MIVVTGAAGFIGSYLVGELNKNGIQSLILVDDFSREDKNLNLENKRYHLKVDRMEFIHSYFAKHQKEIEFVFHLGARTDTTEQSKAIFDQLNLNYTKRVWEICSQAAIPLVYASSAATYGDGQLGYEDRHDIVSKLQPLNPYGRSKNDFDLWALTQKNTPPFWAGLKFFNVYGPNEYHKGRMASVIFHTYNQIKKTGAMRLFRSHKEGIKNGHQQRDFIYVKDLVKVCLFLKNNSVSSGLYNLGTGQANTFLDLVQYTFKALNKTPDISFIDTPIDIRDTYQYYTQANMSKLISAGYEAPFVTLEEGITTYVRDYLSKNKRF